LNFLLSAMFIPSFFFSRYFFGWQAEVHFSPNNENATRSGSNLPQLHRKEKSQIGTLIPYLTENTLQENVSAPAKQ
jgi:hypothetical protein